MHDSVKVSRRRFLWGASSSLLSSACFGQASPDVASVTDFGAAGNGRADDTAAIQRALGSAGTVRFPAGRFMIRGQLEPRAGQTIILSPDTQIRQISPDTPIFYALGKNGLTFDCHGGTLHGEGSWSAEWVGNGGHYDRGIYLIDCDDFAILRPRIRNCAHAGIAIIGGRRGRIIEATVEGTHRHGHPLPYQANFQNGIYLQNAPDRGAVEGLVVERTDVSGTAQGVMIEGSTPRPLERIVFRNVVIHDIPGQHAFYLQCGNVTVANPIMRNIALAGVKIQASTSSDISDVTVTGAEATDFPNSQMFEVAAVEPATGKVSAVRLEGRGRRVARGLAVFRQVENLHATIDVVDCSDAAVQLAGPELHDIDVTVRATNVGHDGVLITATHSDNIRIRPTIRNPNFARGPYGCGIRVVSSSAEVDIIDPDVSDDHRRMFYGLFNQREGAVVRVRGRVRFTGAADRAVRATGLISEFPADAEVEGANGRFLNAANVRLRPAT
jgi:hypothetical protein